MATKVTMEALSPTMEEGRLVKWLKAEGDAVRSGEVLAEVETDKAVMELTARGAGILRKRLAAEGDASPVGTVLGIIAAADEDITALISGAATPRPSPPAAPAAQQKQPATPPATRPTPSPAPRQSEASPASIPAVHTEQSGASASPVSPGASVTRVRSSPLARRLAAESGLDIARLAGSGPGGRIIKRDILQAEETGVAVHAMPAARARDGDYQDIPLTQIRKTIARRLSESIGPIPTFYLTAEFDLERVAEMRGAMAELGDDYKVSFNDIVMKAIATALTQHPECNAHWLGDHIRQFNRVHLGMAVATDDGLIVPVIFDADAKPMAVIAREARELAGRARERKLKPEEYTGATFSVSNLGMFGIDQFTAIINPPEAGIIAVGAIEERPVQNGSGILFRKRMRVTMSCDHRVIDGAAGARFLQTLRRMIENPLTML